MIGTNLIKTQQPSEATDSELQFYLHNDDFAMSQKLDGHRMIVQTGPLRCYTRQGHEREIPASVRDALGGIESEWIFDGELLDKTYHCFDILSTSKGDIRKWEWHQRQAILAAALKDKPIHVVKQYMGTDAKTEFFERCKEEQVEGVVFARIDGKYQSGRSTNTVKYKFFKTVDCVVIDKRVGDRDNLMLGVYKDEEMVEVGKVSALTGDGPRAEVGDVVTVTILYTTKSGKLYLPTKARRRSDKQPSECLFEQVERLHTNRSTLP